MKVKEPIKELEKFNQDKEVYYSTHHFYGLLSVENIDCDQSNVILEGD